MKATVGDDIEGFFSEHFMSRVSRIRCFSAGIALACAFQLTGCGPQKPIAPAPKPEPEKPVAPVEKTSTTAKQSAETVLTNAPVVETKVVSVDEKSQIAKIEALRGKITKDEDGHVAGIVFEDYLKVEQLDFLTELKHLKKIKLTGPDITDRIVPLLLKIPTLEDIETENTPLGDKILPEFQKFPELTGLGLRRSDVTDDGLAALVPITKLEKLLLLYTGITNDGLKHVGKLSNLKTLDIRACLQIDDKGVEQLAGLKNLRSIKFKNQNPGITAACMKHLTGMKQLKEIGLDDTALSDDGLEVLQEFANSMELLHIERTGVSDAGLANLKPLKKLTLLQARGIPIDGSGLENISELPLLAKLELAETNVNDDGLKHIGKIVSLERLDLWLTKITDAGLPEIANLKKLKWLDIKETDIGDQGFAALAGLTELESLYLDSDKITDKSIDVLSKMTKLKELSIPFTEITDEGYAKLKSALPKTKIAR